MVSGEPFGRYLRGHILEPARMACTTSTVTDDQTVPGLSEGHVIAYGHAFTAPGRGMRRLRTPSAPQVGHALGWATRGPTGAPTRLEHRGSLLTFTSEEALRPESGYGVVLLFNAGSPMMLDQTAIVHGVFDIVEGTAPPSSGPHLAATLDIVLAALTLAALTLGARGVVRSGRWGSTPAWRPAAHGARPAAARDGARSGAAFPRLPEAWIGRDVTWQAAAYGWPALVVFVVAALLAAAVALLARAGQLRRTSSAGAIPAM